MGKLSSVDAGPEALAALTGPLLFPAEPVTTELEIHAMPEALEAAVANQTGGTLQLANDINALANPPGQRRSHPRGCELLCCFCIAGILRLVRVLNDCRFRARSVQQLLA